MGLTDSQQRLISEEIEILSRIASRLSRDAEKKGEVIENLDAQLIELRDAVAEAKEEDVASLVEQMHRLLSVPGLRRLLVRAAPSFDWHSGPLTRFLAKLQHSTDESAARVG